MICMARWFLFGLLLVYWASPTEWSSAVSGQAPIPSPRKGKLSWTNGDALPGQWLGADADSVQWLADSLFRDPLQVDRGYLSAVEFGNDETASESSTPSATTYLIQTTDGGRIFGEIRQLDAEAWTVVSPRLGEIRLRRDAVVAVQNLATAGQWAAGRFDLPKWQAARGQKRFWQVNSQGHLLATRQNLHLYREAELPASCLIDLELSWTKKLDFLVALGVPENARQADQLPRLETWDDALVFSYGDNFEIVLESFLNPQRRVRLLLHWDQARQSVAIHDATGKLLCAADLSDVKVRRKSGIHIENKAGDLTVTQLAIRQSEPGFDSTRSSYQLVDRPAVNGQIVDFDGQTWRIAAQSPERAEATSDVGDPQAAELITIPHADFSSAFSLVPAATSADPARSSETQIEYFDGMFVSGTVLAADAEHLTVTTGAGTEPWSLKLRGARQIKFPAVAVPTDQQGFNHQLVHLVGTMRGRLEPGSQVNGDLVRWRLPGGRSSVPFAAAEAKVTLQKRLSTEQDSQPWPDTLYFYNRDRIPCRVGQIADGTVHFESFAEKQQVDASLLKAIDFQTASLEQTIRPDDNQWLVPERSQPLVLRQADFIEVTDQAILSHATLMRTGGFEFELKWQPGMYGAIEFDLFGDARLERPGDVKFVLLCYDNNLMAQSQANEINQAYVANDRQARVQIRVQGDKLLVLAGKQTLLSQPLQRDLQRGTGVTWKFGRVSDGKFAAQIAQVRHWLPSDRQEATLVSTEQRELLLTIPRLRKNNPPQHILRATNGDLLRGELVSLDRESLQFRAKEDVLRFPRKVAEGLIWLHFRPAQTAAETSRSDVAQAADPADSEPADGMIPDPTTGLRVQVLFAGDRRLTFDLIGWREDQLVGQSAALGQCSIPMEQIEELRFGSFAHQALDVPYADWVARMAPEPAIMTGSDGQTGSERMFGSQSPLLGSELPDLSLTMLDGETVALKSLTGKVVVLDFWATWCSPCIRALPDLMAATSEFSSEDVVLLAVNQEEDVATIQTFLANRGWSLNVGLDNGTLARRLQVQSLPQTIVVGPDGKIAFVKSGYTRDLRESLQRAIASLLVEPTEQ